MRFNQSKSSTLTALDLTMMLFAGPFGMHIRERNTKKTAQNIDIGCTHSSLLQTADFQCIISWEIIEQPFVHLFDPFIWLFDNKCLIGAFAPSICTMSSFQIITKKQEISSLEDQILEKPISEWYGEHQFEKRIFSANTLTARFTAETGYASFKTPWKFQTQPTPHCKSWSDKSSKEPKSWLFSCKISYIEQIV